MAQGHRSPCTSARLSNLGPPGGWHLKWQEQGAEKAPSTNPSLGPRPALHKPIPVSAASAACGRTWAHGASRTCDVQLLLQALHVQRALLLGEVQQLDGVGHPEEKVLQVRGQAGQGRAGRRGGLRAAGQEDRESHGGESHGASARRQDLYFNATPANATTCGPPRRGWEPRGRCTARQPEARLRTPAGPLGATGAEGLRWTRHLLSSLLELDKSL